MAKKRACSKTASFPTKAAARAAIRNHKPDAAGRAPVRAYRCKQHKAFHITGRI